MTSVRLDRRDFAVHGSINRDQGIRLKQGRPDLIEPDVNAGVVAAEGGLQQPERRQVIGVLFLRSRAKHALVAFPAQMLVKLVAQMGLARQVAFLGGLERMSVLSRGDELTLADLPADVRESKDEAEEVEIGSRLESLKRSAILQALDQFDGNRTRAAEYLGISVRTLQRKLRDWGMAGPALDSSNS